MKRNTPPTLQRMARDIVEYDDARQGFTMEHHMVLAAATGLAVSAFMAPSSSSAALRGIGAGLLLMRALAGRQGVRDWLQVRESRPSTALSPDEVRATWVL